jgi:hypothetical protein
VFRSTRSSSVSADITYEAEIILHKYPKAGLVGRSVYGVGLGSLFVRIAGSNPPWGMDVRVCVYKLCCSVSVEAFATG